MFMLGALNETYLKLLDILIEYPDETRDVLQLDDVIEGLKGKELEEIVY